jgi:hypothetical protein
MPSYQNTRKLYFLFLVFLAFSTWSCKSGTNTNQTDSVRQTYEPDTVSFLIKYEGSLFPLPSPYQVAQLIKSNNIPFNESIINSPENAKRYSTNFKKALNFGVYGTNLSYLNIYNQTPESITYLNVLKKLSEELGISPAFDAQFFGKIEQNISNRDSLLVMLSNSYRKADGFLKENDRNEVGALILAGGWIESLYLLTTIAKATSNRDVINRLGEQKHPLDNLIEVLSPLYYKSDEYAELTDKLIDLAYEFDGIIYSYSYKEPKIDVANKTIYINSQSRVIMSEYHLDIISQKVEDIRSLIVE